MIVVDTNVLAYLWLPGEHTQASERLLRDDPEWNAPLLWRSEFRNVLAGCMRRGDVDLEAAIQIASEAERQMRGREFSVPSEEVLGRVEDSNCSAYDCEFVVLAEALGVPLITSDARILKSFPSIARSLEEGTSRAFVAGVRRRAAPAAGRR